MFRLDLGFRIFGFGSLDFAVWILVLGSSLRVVAHIVDFGFLDLLVCIFIWDLRFP